MQRLVFMALADAVSHVIRSDAAEESGLLRRERAAAGWPAGNGTRVIPGGPDGRLVVEDRVVGVPQRHGIWAVVDVGRALRALYVGMVSFAVVGVGRERSDPAAVLAGHVVPVAEVHWPLDEVTHSAIMLHTAVCQDEGSGSPSGSPARSPNLGLALAVPGGRLLHVPGSWDPRSGCIGRFPRRCADDSTAGSVAAARIVRRGGSRLQLLLHVQGTLIAVGGQPVQQ